MELKMLMKMKSQLMVSMKIIKIAYSCGYYQYEDAIMMKKVRIIIIVVVATLGGTKNVTFLVKTSFDHYYD